MKQKTKKALTVKVTKKDIEKGIMDDATACPIARALHKLYVRKVRVGTKYLEFDGDGYMDAELPHTARQFIKNFDDDRESVSPFSFKLTLCPL